VKQPVTNARGFYWSGILDACKDTTIPNITFEELLAPIITKPKPFRTTMYPLVNCKELYEMVSDAKGLKHLYEVEGVVQFIENDPMLSLNVAFYQEILNRAGVNIKLWQYAGEHSKLKELSQWAQKSGPKVKKFHMLVGIENLYGWRPNTDDISQDVRDWVEKVFEPVFLVIEITF